MAKVNKDDFGKRRPKLVVEDLDGGEATALTMASVERVTMDDGDGKRHSLAITFEETGDKVYWPNVSSIGLIIDEYGDDDDDWIGKPLPLMRNTGTFKGQKYENLQVPERALWDEIFTDMGFKVPTSKRVTAKPAKAVKTTKKARGR